MPSGYPDRTKLRNLTPAAWSVLAHLESATIARYLINPGILDRLYRESLIDEVWVEVKGVKRCHIKITDGGRAKLAERRKPHELS